jgi:hypothetical protein
MLGSEFSPEHLLVGRIDVLYQAVEEEVLAQQSFLSPGSPVLPLLSCISYSA